MTEYQTWFRPSAIASEGRHAEQLYQQRPEDYLRKKKANETFISWIYNAGHAPNMQTNHTPPTFTKRSRALDVVLITVALATLTTIGINWKFNRK